MQKQTWSSTKTNHVTDDSNDIQPGNIPANQLDEEEDEEESTLEPVKQAMADREVHEVEVHQNRSMMRKNITIRSVS
jgi:hypothetical protein